MNETPDETPKRSMPLWETLVMAASFLIVWGWYLARQAAHRTPGGLPGNPISPLWHLALAAATVALIVVLRRRMKRVQEAFRENAERGPYPFPPGAHGGGRHGKRK